MTELFIDKQPVVLPDKLNLKVMHQNPFFTKNGAFTLDISLSLKSETNARLYGHTGRLHSGRHFTGRSACLVVDNRRLLNGTEIVLSNTQDEVRIQIVSGNSELNYFVHAAGDLSELYVSALDLGEEDDLSAGYLNSILDTKYPAAGFAPQRVWTGDIMVNGYLNVQLANNSDPYPFANIAIQPYLLNLLVKIIQALGYSVKQNELLNDDALCRLFILNDIRDKRYNRMLPGWTVKEFLEACERFLNISFDIDALDRSVRIVKNSSGITLEEKICLEEVLDDYERTAVDDENGLLAYENVKFPLPADEWYKYQAVSSEIMSMANILTYYTWADLIGFLQVGDNGRVPNAVAADYYKTLDVFYVTEYDTYFIVDRIFYDNGQYIFYWYFLRPIDRFDCLSDDEAEDRDFLELPFCPAQVVDLNTALTDILAHHNIMPSLEGYTLSDDDEVPATESADLTEFIENGIPDADTARKNIFLAFYTGSLPGYERSDFAIDFLQELPFCFGKFNSPYLYTLRLNGPGGWAEKYYRANHNYDFTKEYTLRFTHKTMPDVRSEFIIHNKRFVCKELEYLVTLNGLHPQITGTFYQVK